MIMEAITLWTEEAPGKLLPFYRDVLELQVLRADDRALTVRAGYTDITFEQADYTDMAFLRAVYAKRTSDQVSEDAGSLSRTAPYYHFAINIPENKLDEAKRWIEAKATLGTEAGSDISHSELWDSDSVYFMDPGGNILELIARHTMDNAVDRPFDPKLDLLGVSEMGLPTKDVSRAVDELEALGISTYKRRDPAFNPVGDEEGLFIVVKPGRRWHFTNLTAECFPFMARVKGIGELKLEKNDEGLVITRRHLK